MENSNNDSITGKLRKAEELLASGSPEDLLLARKLFEEVLEKEPGKWQALNGLGLTFASIDTDKSIDYFKLAMQNCDSDAPFFNLGSTYARLGQKNKAIETWEAGVAKTRSKEISTRLLEALGYEYLYGQNDYGKARQYLEQALELKPGNEDILYLLGISYEQEEALDKAEHYYLQVQTNYNAVVQLALLYWKVKKVEDCVAFFEKALTLMDTHVVRFSLAAVYNDARVYDREKALGHLVKGLEMYPHSGSAKNLLKKIIVTMPEEESLVYRDILARLENLGRVPGNPILVDSVREEYEIIKSDSCPDCDDYLEVDKQSLVRQDGHTYDKLATHCRNCQKKRTYWFLIDSFFSY